MEIWIRVMPLNLAFCLFQFCTHIIEWDWEHEHTHTRTYTHTPCLNNDKFMTSNFNGSFSAAQKSYHLLNQPLTLLDDCFQLSISDVNPNASYFHFHSNITSHLIENKANIKNVHPISIYQPTFLSYNGCAVCTRTAILPLCTGSPCDCLPKDFAAVSHFLLCFKFI